MARTHKHPKTDPREGNAGSLKNWLGNPKNRKKMYDHDREAAAALEYADYWSNSRAALRNSR